MEKIKFKRLHPSAQLPARGSINSCGLDIHSIESLTINVGERVVIHTGLAVEIPIGYYGRLAPRSGLALKNGIDLMGGVIDADYRGEVMCLMINLGSEDMKINIGDRIAQLIIEKVAILDPEWTTDLEATERNIKGFGSTGI